MEENNTRDFIFAGIPVILGAVLLTRIMGNVVNMCYNALGNTDGYSAKTIITFITAAVCGFLIGYGLIALSAVYGGSVWGVRVFPSIGGIVSKILSVLGLLIAGGLIIVLVGEVFYLLFHGEPLAFFLGFVICFAFMFIGLFMANRIIIKTNRRRTNALKLEKIPLFKEIADNTGVATFIVVSFEGVALYDRPDNCYAVYFYEDYQLTPLKKISEFALVSGYFVQKYRKFYTAEVKQEVIPEKVGQTAVEVGMGGMGSARTRKLSTQNFSSCILTKK